MCPTVILKRHVGGDEAVVNFSSVYNTGRMLNVRENKLSGKVDGRIAKALRRAFVRDYG